MLYRIAIYTILWTWLPATTLHAQNVLIVTWQGKLPSEKSFEKRLKELQPNVKFHNIDAQRSKTTLAKLLRNTELNQYDLIYSFGTTCSKIVKLFVNGERPHIFNIVSTPVLSGIVDNLENPGNNTTGAKLLISTTTQIEFMVKLKKIKKLVAWYDPREKQNQGLLLETYDITEKLGIELKTFRIIPDAANFNDLLTSASEAANNSDALILLGGSSFHQNAKKLHSKLSPSLFVIAGSKYFVLNGATVALAADFEERGAVVAEQAHEILNGAKAGKIPVSLVTMKNATLFVNKDTMQNTGINILKAQNVGIKMVNQLK